MRHINDGSYVWAKMWDIQVQNGMIPYYMFIARDTGAREYFEIPLAQCLDIYQGARKQVSGLGHTARGPSMSSGPGKICVFRARNNRRRRCICIKVLARRNEDWCDRVFLQNMTKKQHGLIN